MALTQKIVGQPWLYDSDTGDLVGVKNASGSDVRFLYKEYESTTAVTLVEAASTFTTLTMSQGATAAKVRLTSAGAHGLTTAVATNKNVYVLWASGIGVNGLYNCTVASTDTTGLYIDIDYPYLSSTVTISIATPGVITWTGHGRVANDTIRITTTGALPTGLTASTTTYYVKTVLDANTFTVSASSGGTVIDTSGSQSGVHTAYVYYGVPTVAVATTTVTLASFPIAGREISQTGALELFALFSFTATANAKTITATYGGQTFHNSGAVGSSYGSLYLNKIAYARTPGTLISTAAASAGHGYSTGALATLTVDYSQSQTFAITAMAAVANEVITLEAYDLFAH
jgi:hypothetical protein